MVSLVEVSLGLGVEFPSSTFLLSEFGCDSWISSRHSTQWNGSHLPRMAAEKETEAGPYHHWAQARLVLLRLALLHFADTEFWLFCGGALFFYKLKVGGNFELSKSASTFFSNCICPLHVCVTFWQFSLYSEVCHYFSICNGDLWSVTFDVTIGKRL